uniref:Coat protein n=1 Tax=Tobacco mosaic virus TaxID=12242 RepID=A0A0D3MFU4_9VIRU|nr:coat protein [Tobacco mosaic virus]
MSYGITTPSQFVFLSSAWADPIELINFCTIALGIQFQTQQARTVVQRQFSEVWKPSPQVTVRFPVVTLKCIGTTQYLTLYLLHYWVLLILEIEKKKLKIRQTRRLPKREMLLVEEMTRRWPKGAQKIILKQNGSEELDHIIGALSRALLVWFGPLVLLL